MYIRSLLSLLSLPRTRRWGESAGAISVAMHLLTNGGNTEGLFRGAFMQSGSPIPSGPITDGQADYDGLVAATGCSGASDTLQCLREVEYDKLKAAVNATPSIFSYQVMTTLYPRRLATIPDASLSPFAWPGFLARMVSS